MEVVANKNALINLLQTHENRIKSFGVKNVDLFGSFLTNNITAKSDIDLLVDFDHRQKTFDNLMDLGFFLEDLLGRKVDIVTPQSLNKHIGPHIVKRTENVIR